MIKKASFVVCFVFLSSFSLGAQQPVGEELVGEKLAGVEPLAPPDLDLVSDKTPIDEAEHDYLCKLQAWGAEHGHEAIADPRKKLDPMKTPVLF